MALLSALLFILAAQQDAAAFSTVFPSSARVSASSNNVRDPLPSLHGLPHNINKEASQNFAPLMSRNVAPLMLSSANDEEVATSDGDKKLVGRKNRVIVGYKAMMISYLTVGLISAAKAGISVPILHVIAGYIAMPAGISYIMISAAKNDRMSSDTYKRLNLALLEYGLVGLAGAALGGNMRRHSMLTLSFVLSVINSTKGYAYGVLGWDKQNPETTLLKDLLDGTKRTVKGFVSIPQNFKSAGYLAATTMIASLKLLKLSEIIKFIQANSVTAEMAPLLIRFNRLALFTLVLYTLKDAADRDRLGGTTFIHLNYLSSLAMGVQCAFYSGGGVFTGASAFFAAFFAFNGISSYMKNHYA